MKLKSKKNNEGKELVFSSADIRTTLQNIMSEILAEGLVFDDEAKKYFTKEEFDTVALEYNLYGNLFGIKFIEKLMEKLSELKKQFREEEK